MTKRRVVKKKHPWRIFNPYTTKPAALKEIMSYVAENPNHNKGKKITSKKGIRTRTI